MRCLITGANGFASSHLIDLLLAKGHDVVGTVRIRAKRDNITHLEGLPIYNMDLSDPFGVAHVVRLVRPEAVFHLAAQSFVGWSWNHPEETIKTNVMGTLYLLEAVRDHAPKARVHIASSSQVYGKVAKEDLPMGKKTLFNPMNPYDSSKLAQEMLSLQYYNSYGIHVVRTRSFNISGPRRGESFAESSWATQVAEIEKGADPVIKHGNLDSARDYVDVRDVVRGYEKACFEGEPGGLYLIGSGQSRKMGEILDVLIKRSTSERQIKKVQDPNRMRPSDTPEMYADISDLPFLVGNLLYSFEETMLDLLNYWREKA